MDRYEQIGADLLRLDDPVAKLDEIVAVANEHAPHARLGIHQRLQPLGDRKRDVFFVSAAASLGAGIFAAVPGVDRNRDQPCHVGCGRRFLRIGYGCIGGEIGRRCCRLLRCGGFCRRLLRIQQCEQWIDRLRGIHV